jgi:large subunit ribosomal protein L22
MEVSATAKYIRVQPRKVRIIADEVRGKNAGHAAALLHHHTSKGAASLRKVLISAVANAVENHGLAPETLKIAAIMVDEGPRLKRMTAKAMGRGARILKKTSHITVVVEDAEAPEAVRPHGAKPKARPTFATKPGRPVKAAAAVDESPSTVTPESAPVEEPEVTPGTESAAATPEEATPVDASDAPEEGGSATPKSEENA